MQPEFEDEDAINPFDFWQGANFKLKIRKVDGYWNYDKSEFEAVSPLLEDEDALEALWNSGNEADKDTVRKQKRKLSYYANIYVVKDPTNPQNEGGVFLYKFGKKIFDKVMEAMQPEFEDETPINPLTSGKVQTSS